MGAVTAMAHAAGRLFPVEVLACTDWGTNGELIADVAQLYFPENARVLDVTYGRGNWWTVFKPADFTAHDLYKLDGVDFRQLPHADATFDVVAFDPPYVPSGWLEPRPSDPDAEITGYLDRFGIEGAPARPSDLLKLITDGLAECARVVRKGGIVLIKCQPYQAGRNFQHVPSKVIAAGETMGLRLIDDLVHRRPPGPKSADGFHRARRNQSNLLVFNRRHRPLTAPVRDLPVPRVEVAAPTPANTAVAEGRGMTATKENP